jgi:uncharacterized protein (DUF924 family)
MTIDERLEALTHSVELLAGMQIETEKRVQSIASSHEQTEKVIRRFGRFAMAITLDHESRITNLELGDEN